MTRPGLKLTIFTVFTIIVTFWLASIIGKLSPFDDTYQVKAVFSDATGILNGDPVKIAGVDVGKVTSFEVDKGHAVVTLELAGDVDVPENVGAEVKFRNLLGQRVINLVRPPQESVSMLADGDTIPVENTRPPLDLASVFNNLRPLIQSTNPEDINTVARAVLEVFKGRESDLARVLHNVAGLSETLAGRDHRLARLVTDVRELTDVLNGQSSNLKVSLDKFSTFMESVSDLTPEIERVVVQLESASETFGSLLARQRSNLDQELSDLNTLLGIVNDNLGPLDKITKNLKEVLLATARSQSYGRWWNLYVVNYCAEPIPRGCGGL